MPFGQAIRPSRNRDKSPYCKDPHMYLHLHTHVTVHIRTPTHVPVHIHPHIYLYKPTHTHTPTHVPVYIHTPTHVPAHIRKHVGMSNLWCRRWDRWAWCISECRVECQCEAICTHSRSLPKITMSENNCLSSGGLDFSLHSRRKINYCMGSGRAIAS